MKTVKFGLNNETIEKLQSIFKQFPSIETVLIYGSRAKGNFHKGSDIDLSIIGDALNTSDLLAIENEIDDLLLPYKIDLSLIKQIENQELLDHIKRVGQVFFTKDN